MNYYNCCKNLKNKKGKPFCKILNREIKFEECSCCNNKIFPTRKEKPINNFQIKKSTKSTKKSAFLVKKSPKMPKKVQKVKKMRNQTYKHQKADRNRFSIIYDDLSVCCYPDCECNTGINKHEVFYGSYRHTSIKWGLVIPLCEKHHTIDNNSIHKDRKFDLSMKFKAQSIFENKYSHDLFMKEFKIDYINKYKKRSSIY